MNYKKRAAVVLSGCGHKDGAEITEAVCTLVALAEAGAEPVYFAPDMEFPVADPFDGKPTGETRNVLTESARIARGNIKPLSKLRAEDFDCLAFPGGTGAALHLCNWFEAGARCQVNADVERVLKEFYAAGKPIGAVCIAPVLIARVLGSKGVTVTAGSRENVAAEIEKTGARHEDCAVDDYVTDREHRVVSTPAYMHPDARPEEIFAGIRGAMRELVEMA